MKILVLNCGSSSVKYMVYDWERKEIACKGIVERVTIGGSFCVHEATGRDEFKVERNCPTHKEAIHPDPGTVGGPRTRCLEKHQGD